MAWPSMDHCHVPLLALAWSPIITGSGIGAHKFMDICGSTVTEPLSPKRHYLRAVARALEQRRLPKAGFYASVYICMNMKPCKTLFLKL